MTMRWGILGPGAVESTRRTRTLGLVASTRLFNDLSVPGLGGVWFGKQLLLATLGVLLAERAIAGGHPVTKIAVANAVEALACWLALSGPHRAGDGRIRGSTKLAGLTGADFAFGNASRSGFYVTQPMRMATVTTLPALGLVEASGSRFNGFACSDAGLAFVKAACGGLRPFKVDLIDHLLRWVLGQTDRVDSPILREALSPTTPMPLLARELLRERLHQGAPDSPAWERERRSDALRWVESRRRGALPALWDERPEQIRDPAHWADMRAGARFFAARDAAYAVLDELELHIGMPENRFPLDSVVPERIQDRLAALRVRARAFLELGHADREANGFCREVVTLSDEGVLRHLVDRDGRILRLVGQNVCSGPAFRGGESPAAVSEPGSEESPPSDDPNWPEDISYRIRNLWWLSLDLEGGIDDWLNPATGEPAHG